MAHIFEIMSIVTAQITILSDYYNNPGKSNIRKLPEVPKFIYSSIDRYLLRHYDEIVYDKNKPITTKICLTSDTENVFNPVYISVINNVTKPIIDKISIHVDNKEKRGPGICIFVGIPRLAFNENFNADLSSQLLREVYFGLLGLDDALQYKPGIEIIRVANDKRIDIYSYDIQMNYVALLCMNIIMKNWFEYNKTSNVEDLTLCSFTNEELPEKVRNNIIQALIKFGTNISSVRDSIEKGTLMEFISKE